MKLHAPEQSTLGPAHRRASLRAPKPNASVVDLGQIDLLVEQGFYSSRTDFIRTAVRNQMVQHAEVVRQTVTRKTAVLGVASYRAADLEKLRKADDHVDITVVGLLSLTDDVTPELARATIRTLDVRGVFRASEAVKAALADRMK
ncbi:MAG: CopG family transcriptional regulator [Symbiobacteriia bacterium]